MRHQSYSTQQPFKWRAARERHDRPFGNIQQNAVETTCQLEAKFVADPRRRLFDGTAGDARPAGGCVVLTGAGIVCQAAADTEGAVEPRSERGKWTTHQPFEFPQRPLADL
jgi:hypothetical protein